MPCLDEAGTIGACIARARRALDAADISGEIIVADRGSTDGSRQRAASLGARVVHAAAPGHGSALMAGIAAARGLYIVVGDADGSYDFGELPRFVARLREGYDLVQGCRLRAGGGTVAPGAMTRLSRWLGNPVFSWLVRRWLDLPINDMQCGLRAFTKALYLQLDHRPGLDLPAETAIQARRHGARIAEVPVTLHRRDGAPRAPLPTAPDRWRTLQLLLAHGPRSRLLGPHR